MTRERLAIIALAIRSRRHHADHRTGVPATAQIEPRPSLQRSPVLANPPGRARQHRLRTRSRPPHRHPAPRPCSNPHSAVGAAIDNLAPLPAVSSLEACQDACRASPRRTRVAAFRQASDNP